MREGELSQKVERRKNFKKRWNGKMRKNEKNGATLKETQRIKALKIHETCFTEALENRKQISFASAVCLYWSKGKSDGS